MTGQPGNQIAADAATTMPVSGRYDGAMTQPQPGRFSLDLRVDIDSAVSNSPVMNRVSGDFYQVFQTTAPEQPPRVAKTYIGSWIIDTPQVTVTGDHVDISGSLRFWTGTHPATTLTIAITRDVAQHTCTAIVTLSETGGDQRSFACKKSSDCFRSLTLETAVCKSINAAPLRPSYDTHWNDDRPAELPQRVLSVEAAYRETGVDVAISPNATVIDDSTPEFHNWTVAELHDAMERHFSLYGGTWPNWAMWGLLAGSYEDSAVAGLMFDAKAADDSNARNAAEPERRGFAIFRSHDYFQALVDGDPQNPDQAAAMRKFLYAFVHEAGHAFNFLHSWDKGKPDSLSWMNYDYLYDQRHQADSFWKQFAFRFDDDELIHLRHGDRASVIMGGDPWSSGSHLESPNLAMAQIQGEPPLELVIRAQPYFDLMEPVLLEVRLRNLQTDAAVVIDKRLAPEYGALIVYIQKPDRHIVQYDPIICAIGKPQPVTLQPANATTPGDDRFSRDIFLSYGAGGFYFDQPGEYRIRAIYQGHGDLMVTSNTLRTRIGAPVTQEANRFTQDYFSNQVGLSLYLQGSRSPYLKKGTEVLHKLADRYKTSLLGANTAIALAEGLRRPFFRVAEPPSPKTDATAQAEPPAPKIVMAEKAQPKEALNLTAAPLKLLQKGTSPLLNLAYARVVRRRAEYHEAAGTPGAAKQELTELQHGLAKRGVNPPVLRGYAALAERFAGAAKASTRRRPATAAKRPRPRPTRRARGKPRRK